MPDEIDPKEIIGLPLHPVSSRIQLCGGKDIRLFTAGKDLEPQTDIIGQIVEMINDRQFPTYLIRIVDRGQISQKLEPQLPIVKQVLQDL